HAQQLRGEGARRPRPQARRPRVPDQGEHDAELAQRGHRRMAEGVTSGGTPPADPGGPEKPARPARPGRAEREPRQLRELNLSLDKPIYTISVASEILETHPRTL